MSKWPVVPLGEVLRHRKEFTEIDDLKSYKRCRVQLHAKGVVLRDELPGAAIKTKKQQVCRANEFLVAEIDAKLGGYGIVPRELDGAIVSSHYFLFGVDQALIDRGYLGYFIRTPTFLEQVAAQGSTNYAAIRPAHVLEYTISLPPLAEQRRLVGRIYALAAKIEEAKGLRASLARETEFLPRAAMSEVFSAIIGEAVPLHEVCTAIVDCLHSNPVYAETGVPTVRSPDVGWGELMLDSARRTSEAEYGRRTARGEPAPGDIVVVREGGGTGKAGIVLPGQRFSLGQRVMMLRPDPNRIDPQYLLYYWLSPLVFDDHIVGRMKGSASPHLNIGAAREFPIRIPALSRQRQIVEYLDKVQARFRRLNDGQDVISQEIDALLPAILDRAFRGEL